MTKAGGNTRVKRSAAPGFWKIPRKRYRFVVTTRPGPHRKESSYPLLLLVRDILGLAKTYREAKSAIVEGAVMVDGVPRKEPSFPVGMMDIIEIPSIGKVFRIVPREGRLFPLEITGSEKSQKLCRAERKSTVGEGMIQCGTHDGRTFLFGKGTSVKPGDALLVEVPSQKVLSEVRMQPDVLVLVTAGKLSGKICKVLEVIPGTFTRERTARINVDGSERELPTSILLPIGKDNPVIKIAGG